jgi:hypothetical protein
LIPTEVQSEQLGVGGTVGGHAAIVCLYRNREPGDPAA